jgi:catechol 2,3-dioxygenase-like lactoylglutathione lyase family enzyme
MLRPILNTVKLTNNVKNEVVMNRTVGITLDSVDVEAAAALWKEALGYEEPVALADDAQFHALVSPGEGLHHLTFQRVPEPKSIKNRLHLDLFVDDLNTEVRRLIALGARKLEENDDDGGYRTAVLADPVGNEFCVVQR